MEIAKKEKWLAVAGLGMALAGVVWFILSIQGVLDGMLMMMGYFLGAGLALGGLIVAGVYFFRRRKIINLLGGKNLLAQWKDGESMVLIATDCAYVDNKLHLWSGPGSRLDQVYIVEKELFTATRSYLEIEYANAVQSRDLITGVLGPAWRSHKLSIRIPPEQLDDLRMVMGKLQEKIAA